MAALCEPLDPAKPFAKLNVHQRSAPHRYARILDAAYGALKGVGLEGRLSDQ